MSGIAIALDLFSRKNPSLSFSSSSSHNLFHRYGAFSSKLAASSFAAGTPFAYSALFGNVLMPVAYCDAGETGKEDDYVPDFQGISGNIFQNIIKTKEKIFQQGAQEYFTKDYPIDLKPLFSAFGFKSLALTSLRSFLLYYLPLLEPRPNDDDEDDFLPDNKERPVDLVTPFRRSVKQIIRETTVVTTRRVLERLAVHYVSQRMAWKLLKDAPRSALRKAQRGMPTVVYSCSVCRTTFRGHCLGVAASWIVQIGIELYHFFRSVFNSEEYIEVNKIEEAKVLGRNISSVTIRCGSSLIFASIGAGIGATLFRPSAGAGQWIGCAIGDLAGPAVVAFIVKQGSPLSSTGAD